MTLRNHFHTMIHLVFLCFCITTFSSLAADTISGNATLSGDQTIVSSGGNFELGFFTPGNSSKHYIGIWYKKVSKKTVVWVANRETPVSDKNSAQLKILEGNLVLLNESQTKIWSTDTNSTASDVVAVLLDDGNLVLRDGSESNSSISQPLWESFDNPADTWFARRKDCL
ncbi:G-type lectin S-receptor-like serine/threonine-protein kinase [Sesamum alatum]|uniref:G-type lectin S-receptor-like serine/threonine-protein kinase n=1 Tax=Sesamum alatum TaxID=300844 RepID=A0AAE1YXH3_9LAMI|nr:G-type lectin S-receptor-like serine/threonine-protein kinase [Sesamum alatum]